MAALVEGGISMEPIPTASRDQWSSVYYFIPLVEI
jgi:hypothetical protein